MIKSIGPIIKKEKLNIMTYTMSVKRNYRFFGATLVEIHCTDKKRNARFS